jgi:hypothetical protein
MLHAYVQRFNVTGNVKNFCKIFRELNWAMVNDLGGQAIGRGGDEQSAWQHRLSAVPLPLPCVRARPGPSVIDSDAARRQGNSTL